MLFCAVQQKLAAASRGRDLAPIVGLFLSQETTMSLEPTPAVKPRPSPATPTAVNDVPITKPEAIKPAFTEPLANKPQAIETTAATMTQGISTVINNTETLVAFGKDNLEAFATASTIWTAGVQDLTKQFASTTKASFEESIATFKALSSVKSVKEAIDLQSTLSKSMVTKALAESNKLTDASIKLTEQTMAPITARIAAAAEVFSKTA
jgi:phasin family protein